MNDGKKFWFQDFHPLDSGFFMFGMSRGFFSWDEISRKKPPLVMEAGTMNLNRTNILI